MTRTFLLFVSLLGGCAPEARNIALSDINLSDMQTVRKVREQLSPQDGAAFVNYVVKHHVESASFCGRPLLTTEGEAPETVGEAIDLTARRDAVEPKVDVGMQAPFHPRELAKERWDDLIRSRDIMIDAKARLRLEFGDEAKRRPEWTLLETRMADIDRKLVAMKPTVFGSGT